MIKITYLKKNKLDFNENKMLLLSNEDPTKYAQIKKNILYLSNKDKFFSK